MLKIRKLITDGPDFHGSGLVWDSLEFRLVARSEQQVCGIRITVCDSLPYERQRAGALRDARALCWGRFRARAA